MFRIGSKIYVPVLVFVFVFASLALIPAAADAYDWNAADGDWSVGSNWNPAGPPTSADCVFIDNSGIVRITGDAVINNIYAGWYNSSSIVMQIGILIALTFVSIGFGPDMPGGYVGTGDIGDAGTALFEQTGGTFTSEMELYIGYKASAQGQYNLSAGNLEAAYECVGYQGVGEFNQTGGSHTADELYIGEMAGSWGEYTFTGGSLEIGALTINNGWLDIDLSEIEFFRVMGRRGQPARRLHRRWQNL